MTRKPGEKTFAEIVAEERKHPSAKRPPIRPGGFDLEGAFFDPDGRQLQETKSEITPKQARTAVQNGALLVFEGCGCGGGPGGAGCTPEWLTEDQRSALLDVTGPRFVKGFGSPTWIDLWENDYGQVVFAHGDVEWGDLLI